MNSHEIKALRLGNQECKKLYKGDHCIFPQTDIGWFSYVFSVGETKGFYQGYMYHFSFSYYYTDPQTLESKQEHVLLFCEYRATHSHSSSEYKTDNTYVIKSGGKYVIYTRYKIDSFSVGAGKDGYISDVDFHRFNFIHIPDLSRFLLDPCYYGKLNFNGNKTLANKIWSGAFSNSNFTEIDFRNTDFVVKGNHFGTFPSLEYISCKTYHDNTIKIGEIDSGGKVFVNIPQLQDTITLRLCSDTYKSVSFLTGSYHIEKAYITSDTDQQVTIRHLINGDEKGYEGSVLRELHFNNIIFRGYTDDNNIRNQRIFVNCPELTDIYLTNSDEETVDELKRVLNMNKYPRYGDIPKELTIHTETKEYKVKITLTPSSYYKYSYTWEEYEI